MNDDPTSGATPPPFDAMANLRALGEVQRRGLEAANRVIAQLIDQVDRTPRENAPTFGADGGVASGTSGAAPGDPVTQWAELTARWFAALAPTTARSAAPVDGSVTVEPVTLAPVLPGGVTSGEFWVHNRSGAAVPGIEFHCGDLRSHTGWSVPAGAVRFDPSCVEELPDRSSRGIGVTVDVPRDVPSGTYRGVLLAANLVDLWLPIEVVVR